MKKNKLTLVADIGGTNARLALIENNFNYQKKRYFKTKDFGSFEALISYYLQESLSSESVDEAIFGVAAPITADRVQFVNSPLSFSQMSLKKNFNLKKLTVLNDLELQAYYLMRPVKKEIQILSKGRIIKKSGKVLVSPGTGLGLSFSVGNKVLSTEAGHLYVPSNIPKIRDLVNKFTLEFKRIPTFEDLLSSAGIVFIYQQISKSTTKKNSKRILENKTSDKFYAKTRELYIYLLAIYLRYVALIFGAKCDIYLSGSIIKSISKDLKTKAFRKEFENSDKMKILLLSTSIFIINSSDIGLKGARNYNDIL